MAGVFRFLLGFFALSLGFISCAHEKYEQKQVDIKGEQLAKADATIHEAQLKNGLKLLFMPDHSAPVATVQVWYRAGSRNEQQGKRGLAHLVEHMMFKGSDNVAPEEHARIIAAVGGKDNAFTTEDVTAYFETVPVERLHLALDLEAERMAHLKVDPTHFFKEREVVKEEIRMRQQNDPWGALFEKFSAVAFTTHPYRFAIGGSLEDLDNISRDDVEAFYKTYYAPNNAVLVVVGDSDFATVKAMTEKLFAKIPSKKAPPTVTAVEPPQTETRHVQIYFPTQLPAVLAGYKTPEASNADSDVLSVIETLLGDGQTARIHQALVRQQKLAAFVSVFNEEHHDPGMFSLLAAYLPGKDPKDIEAALISEVNRLGTEGPSPKELQKAKTQLTAHYLFDLSSIQRVGFHIGFAETVERDYRSFLAKKTAYDKITADDVKRVVTKYLNAQRLTVAYLAPPDKDHPVVKAQASDIQEAKAKPVTWPSAKRFTDIVATKAKALSMPPIHRQKLANGLQVIIVERHDLPLVYFDLMVPGGNNLDPAGQEGQADLFASMLSQGSRHRSAEEWAAAVESLGGEISASAAGEYIDVNGQFLSRDLQQGLSLFSDAVLFPSFSAEELERIRPEEIATVRNMRSQPVSLAMMHAYNMIYGNADSRGRPAEESSLKAVDVDALKARHQQYFVPDGSYLLIVGDVEPQALTALIKDNFGAWKGKFTWPALREPELAKTRQLRIIDKPDLTQASIVVAHLGVTRQDPDYLNLTLGNWVLGGGGFSSRMMRRLRSEGGKTYSVGSFISARRSRGIFGAYTFTRSAEVKATLDMLLDEIQKAQDKGISEAELQKAKNNLAGGYVLRLQAARSLGDALIGAAFYQMGDNWVRDYPLRVTAPTLQEVNAALHTKLHNQALSIAVVGPAKSLQSSLTGFASVEVVDALAPISAGPAAVKEKTMTKKQAKAKAKARKGKKS